jgi:hypothetical protein
MAAEEIIFKVGVDTGNSVNDLNKVEQGLNDIDKSAQSIGTDAASRFEALNKKIEAGGMTMRQAKQALKEYQDIALQAGRTSPIGQAAIQAAGELKDTIGDLRTELTNAGTDGANMQAALQVGTSIAAGYGVIQGTMALVGSESEALTQSMQKLIAVQTVLQSIEQIRANFEKESFLMQKARTAATYIQTAATSGLAMATGVLAAATGGASTAMKVFRIALISTGIGAIVVAIGLLISNFDKVTEAVQKAYNWFNKLGPGIKVVIGVLFPFIGAIYGVIKALEYFGVIDDQQTAQMKANAKAKTDATEKEMNKKIAAEKRKAQAVDDNLSFEIRKAEAAGKNTEEMEERKLQAALKSGRAILQMQREKIKAYEEEIKILRATGDADSERFKQLDKALKATRTAAREQYKENKKNSEDLTVMQIENETERTNAAREAAEKRRADAEKAAEKRRADEEKEAQLRLERQKELEDLINLNIADADERALMQLQTKHRREREEIVKKYGENSDVEKQLQIQQATELQKLTDEQKAAADAKAKADQEKADADAKAALDKKLADQKAAAELELLQAEENFYAQQEAKKKLAEIEMQQALSNDQLTANERLLIQQQYADKVKAIDDETTKHEEANAKMLSDAKLKIAQDSLQLIQNITELFGKKNEKAAKIAFNVDKAAKIASATIAGIEGTINAYKTAQGSPITALLPAYPTIQAGLAAAFAATNIAKIARTQFQSSGGGASSQAAVSAPSQGTPAVPLPEGQTTLTAGLPGGGGQQGSKVYVLDSDITAQQTMSGKVQALATFGG